MTNARCGVSFGPFRLYASERLLEKGDVSVPLGSRALDLLAVLVERAGEVVSKAELFSRAWPKLTVDESSLRFQIVVLRRALGDGAPGARYIKNVPGRSYCFVAPTAVISQKRPALPDRSEPAALSNAVAHSANWMVGRDQPEPISLTASHRFAERKVLSGQQSALSDFDVVTLVEIRRRLDSIALAMGLTAM